MYSQQIVWNGEHCSKALVERGRMSTRNSIHPFGQAWLRKAWHMEKKKEEVSTAHLLLVEDDETNALVLTVILAQETRYQFHRVGNGEEALQWAQAVKPDLFILDYLLPTMNGLELYDQLHALPGYEQIPALFLSASPVKIERPGVTILRKPFELDDLVGTIHSLLSPHKENHDPGVPAETTDEDKSVQ
jgi:CheY-like chemotaxis protein